MKAHSSEHLIAAVNRIIDQIGSHAEIENSLELNRLDACARSLCCQLKALQDLDAYNLRQCQIDNGKKYIRYEDLPPLIPEERDRFRQELIDLLAPRKTRTGKAESA